MDKQIQDTPKSWCMHGNHIHREIDEWEKPYRNETISPYASGMGFVKKVLFR